MGGQQMTTADVNNVQILVNLKDGGKLLGVSEDGMVFNLLAGIVQFMQVDEKKFASVPVKEIIKHKQI